MFVLDLFNTDHERRLAEGAVDQLEQRRIDDLAMQMDSLVARAKTATTAEVKQALMKEFQKCKAERDSYHMVRNETMGYGSLGEETHEFKGAHGKLDVERTPGKTVVTRKEYPDSDEMRADRFPNKRLKGLGTGTAVKGGSGVASGQGSMRKFPKLDHDANDAPNYGVDEGGIPGNVPTEKIPGKEDLLKGKGRSYYESQKKNSEQVEEGRMSELDAMRQDLEQMNERQFYTAYGISKAAFEHKYRTLLKPALDEGQGLHAGDPVVVTGSNEFAGKTGEIAELSPSGKFVIVDLYNHGRHSMHLSDVAYNDYADQEEADDWYDDADEFGKPGSEFFPEGYQDFNKVEPYAVCLAGKPVKQFDYYEDARRFHDNWKKKLYREGDKAKADKITLMPLNLDEAVEDYAGIYSPEAITLGKRFCDHYNITDDGDIQLAVEIIDSYLNEFKATNTPVDLKKIRSGVADAFRQVYRGMGPGPTFRKKFQEQKPVDPNEFRPVGPITIVPPKKLKSGETHQGINDYWKAHGQAPIYKTNEAGNPAQQAAIAIAKKKQSGVAEGNDDNKIYDRGYRDGFAGKPKNDKGYDGNAWASYRAGYLDGKQAAKSKQGVAEAGSPAQQAAIAIAMKRAGKKPKSVDENTVQIPHKGKMVSGKVVRKDPVSGEYIVDVGEYGSVRVPAHKVKHDVEETTAFLTRGPRLSYGDQTQHATLGPVQVEKVMPDGSVVVYCERDGKRYRTSPSALKSAVAENQDTSAVESAIIRRIMVSHTDLLQQFGPDKVMQAAEEVAYNVGDVDEIGTSDVSAWVNEVKQILGAE